MAKNTPLDTNAAADPRLLEKIRFTQPHEHAGVMYAPGAEVVPAEIGMTAPELNFLAPLGVFEPAAPKAD